ncbi:thiamine diphosphokinase [Malassezia vespertilionis]|uniref:Nudix hydrolase domain-containing protein n=1 Tax=Malassezia vespertilionis TaxID=2020962 RepID=A0A2N1JA47_9BASI|nr:thiamine diphosphokinase [Malassezia vespertilionis]PKI83431.1 hypothetical protein MVES_002506 [Malassezia vespertilionis]WFD07295.1 thiamine diphosphokinase [Malassezia vespertilionis]
MTLLAALHKAHNCDPWTDRALHAFVLDDVQIGFVQPRVLDAIRQFLRETLSDVLVIKEDGAHDVVTLAHGTSRAQRTAAMSALVAWMRARRIFPDPLDGWRDEPYAVYARAHGSASRSHVAFTLERAACALFGFATFGVHLTAYTPDGRIWVSKRSRTKQTWPSYYDNSVAGGIIAGDAPMASMIRECYEEAGLTEEQVTPYIKQTGCISYFHKTDAGWYQPEMQFTYDLALPSTEIVLAPVDGEAESFELLDKDAVLERVETLEFKPNCALVVADFFARHGMLTFENEEHYTAILECIHTPLRLPTP